MSTTPDLVKAPHVLGVPKVDVRIDDQHRYTVNGGRVRGVSSILTASGLKSEFDCDQWYLDRGTYIHQSLALAAKNRLDIASLPAAYRGHVESGIKYLAGRTNAVCELVVGSAIHGFAGTLDLVLLDEAVLVDWKSGGAAAWHKLQVAGYRIALRETYGIRVRRAEIVYLSDEADKAAKVVKVDTTEDAHFLAAVNFMRTYDYIHPRKAKETL